MRVNVTSWNAASVRWRHLHRPELDGNWHLRSVGWQDHQREKIKVELHVSGEDDERPDPLAPPEGYGSRIGRLEHLTAPAKAVGHDRVTEVVGVEPDEPSEDGICDFFQGKDRCASARMWRIIAGDISEHIQQMDLCPAHMVQVSQVPRFWCTRCRQDMKLEKVGHAEPDGTLTWLEPPDWPLRLQPGPKPPPERLF